MENIINSIKLSLDNKNYYAALMVALTIPDICVSLEFEKTNGNLYAKWFEDNLKKYKDFITGNDCYALRCALLHNGKDDVTNQSKKDILDYYVFLEDGKNLVLFKDGTINGIKMSFLGISVYDFCNDIINAVSEWLVNSKDNNEIQIRLKESIEIHKRPYNHMGAIMFN